MQVRCQRCSWVFTLNLDAIGMAVAEAEALHAEFHQEPCPKCRNAIKIQVKELRRRLPPGYQLPPVLPKPEPVHVKTDAAKHSKAQPTGRQPAATSEPKSTAARKRAKAS